MKIAAGHAPSPEIGPLPARCMTGWSVSRKAAPGRPRRAKPRISRTTTETISRRHENLPRTAAIVAARRRTATVLALSIGVLLLRPMTRQAGGTVSHGQGILSTSCRAGRPLRAGVAELADALASGASPRKRVE